MKVEFPNNEGNNVPQKREEGKKNVKADEFDKMMGNVLERVPGKNGEKKGIVLTQKQKEELLLMKEGLVTQGEKKTDKTEKELAALLSKGKKVVDTGEKKGELLLNQATEKKGKDIELVITPQRKRGEVVEQVPLKDVKSEKVLEAKGDTKPEATDINEKKTEKGEPINKDSRISVVAEKIVKNPEISEAMKEKLLNLLENKKQPSKVIEDLKKEIVESGNKQDLVEIKESKSMIKFESKMEIKEWIGRIKAELNHMIDFRVENENRIRLQLVSGDAYVRMNIEKINNEIVIMSEMSESMKKRVEEVLSEVKIEMKERNIEVRFEKEKEEKNSDEEEERKKEGRRKEDGSDNTDEQRRRGR